MALERARRKLRDLETARAAYRALIVARHLPAARRRPRAALSYVLRSRELTNYTYELANLAEISAPLGRFLGVDRAAVDAVVAELRDDQRLRDELEQQLRRHPKRDDVARYGYRYVYYCVARLTGPRVIAEIGTADGLGSAVLLSALERNAADGRPGTLLAFDESEESGWLVPPRLRHLWQRQIGDALELIDPVLAEHGCDLLIDDIGHGFDQKARLFEPAIAHARESTVLCSEFPARGDHDPPTELESTAAAHDGSYFEFTEDPLEHWWPGHTHAVAIAPKPGRTGGF